MSYKHQRVLQAPTLSSNSHCYLSSLPQMPLLLLLPRAPKPTLPLQYEEFTPRHPVQIGSTAAPPPPTHCASRPRTRSSARRPRRPCSPRCPCRRGGPRNLRGAKRKGGTRRVTPAAPDHHGGRKCPGDLIDGKRASRAPAPPAAPRRESPRETLDPGRRSALCNRSEEIPRAV